MAVIVNTNVQSLIAQKNLSNSTNAMNTATKRLSTGMKINNAVDDAAGLFIAKGLETQLSGSKQCQTNLSLGVNVLQIAEGDLSTIQDNIMRIKDLATQASNGVYSTSAQKAMSDEVEARLAEINRVAAASNFNGMELFTENAPEEMRLQVGAGSDAAANSITIEGVFGSLVTSAAVGGGGLGLDGTVTFGANFKDAAGVQFKNKNNEAIDSIEKLFQSATACAIYIQKCEDAINEISEKRSNIGVIQSRLEMASQGLATTIENISAAKSTIMDTDIAATTAEYTQKQILQQISSSMLLQAIQAPSVALSLLG